MIEKFLAAPIIETAFDNLEQALDLAVPHLLHLEFGVFNGSSIRHMALYAPERRFFGFDSFEGLPEPWDTGREVKPKGHLTMNGQRPPNLPLNVTLLSGWFEDTLPAFLAASIAQVGFVHIDSDVYSSARYVLTALSEHLAPGAIIVFDELVDWRSLLGEETTYLTWRQHEWRALQEWEAKWEPVARTKHYQGTIRYVGN